MSEDLREVYNCLWVAENSDMVREFVQRPTMPEIFILL